MASLPQEIKRLAGIAGTMLVGSEVKLYWVLALFNEDSSMSDDDIPANAKMAYSAIRALVESASLEGDTAEIGRLIVLELIVDQMYVKPNSIGAERQELVDGDDNDSSEVLVTPEKLRDIRKRIRNE